MQYKKKELKLSCYLVELGSLHFRKKSVKTTLPPPPPRAAAMFLVWLMLPDAYDAYRTSQQGTVVNTRGNAGCCRPTEGDRGHFRKLHGHRRPLSRPAHRRC